ncbi:Uncharacterised protein [uncultured archaeon]|nr:Uncharacterised protein [uncultured archaeon]
MMDSRKYAGMPKEKLEMFLTKLNGGVDFRQIFQNVRKDCYRPGGFSIDPRTGDEIIFSTSRDKRPTTYNGEKCVICKGEESEILPFLMAQKLSSGAYSFVNENKYAFLNPDGVFLLGGKGRKEDDGIPLRGGNFLVWPTTEHKEIYEIPYEDHAVSFHLMRKLEGIFLSGVFEEISGRESVQVIKNSGSSIPGSHVHGPYQVTCSNRNLRKINDDIKFMKREGISFAEFLDKDCEPLLQIADYDTMKLAVHKYSRRPLEAVIYPKDKNVEVFGDLNDKQLTDLARVTSDVSFALSFLMPAMKRSFDYSFGFHIGKGIGTMYVEVFPSSQRPGGFERLGRYICQGTPPQTAAIYRNFLNVLAKGNIITRYDLDPTDEYTINYINRQFIQPALK